MSATILSIVPDPEDENDDKCEEVDVIGIGRGNRSTWKKPPPVPICPP
jgi:hypothetical protein